MSRLILISGNSDLVLTKIGQVEGRKCLIESTNVFEVIRYKKICLVFSGIKGFLKVINLAHDLPYDFLGKFELLNMGRRFEQTKLLILTRLLLRKRVGEVRILQNYEEL